MKRSSLAIGLFLVGFSILSACSRLPRVYPDASASPSDNPPQCAELFASGQWQLSHSIEASIGDGPKGFLIGTSLISTENRSVHSVLMTIEGLVLFDAKIDGKLTLNRAIPPFDSPAFAAGLMRDIELIFFPPTDTAQLTGILKAGESICRYRHAEGGMVDVVIAGNRAWEIRRYDENNRLTRTVKGQHHQNTDQKIISTRARTIELTANDQPGYHLVMTLLEAIQLSH